MTSGTWLTPADSTCSKWSHQVLVVVPKTLSPVWSLDNAALYITGGSTSSGIPQPDSDDVMIGAYHPVSMGTASGGTSPAFLQRRRWQLQLEPSRLCFGRCPTSLAYLRRIQSSSSAWRVSLAFPLVLVQPPLSICLPVSDDIIAFTWNQYLANTSRPDWIVFFPMTRACSRAMDAVTAFVQGKFGPQYSLQNWLTSGASKRGWTTWWTGVVEARVKLIAPLVMDLLNFLPVRINPRCMVGFYSISIPLRIRELRTCGRLLATGRMYFNPTTMKLSLLCLVPPRLTRSCRLSTLS